MNILITLVAPDFAGTPQKKMKMCNNKSANEKVLQCIEFKQFVSI